MRINIYTLSFNLFDIQRVDVKNVRRDSCRCASGFCDGLSNGFWHVGIQRERFCCLAIVDAPFLNPEQLRHNFVNQLQPVRVDTMPSHFVAHLLILRYMNILHSRNLPISIRQPLYSDR